MISHEPNTTNTTRHDGGRGVLKLYIYLCVFILYTILSVFLNSSLLSNIQQDPENVPPKQENEQSAIERKLDDIKTLTQAEHATAEAHIENMANLTKFNKLQNDKATKNGFSKLLNMFANSTFLLENRLSKSFKEFNYKISLLADILKNMATSIESTQNELKSTNARIENMINLNEINKMYTQESEEGGIKGPLNVLIFYPDDWRHDDLGDTNPILRTPFFTKLAKEGIRFTYNAVTSSICWISRATLFTGQWVSRHGSTYLFRSKFVEDPERWSRTWPFLLQRAGYWVGHIGKWQYWSTPRFNFSTFFEGEMWYNISGVQVHTADRCKNEVVRFLKQRPKDRPFALTVALYPPKGICRPQDAPKESLDWYEDSFIPEPHDLQHQKELLPDFLQYDITTSRIRFNFRFATPEKYQSTMKTYYSMITYLDKVFGDIVKELKKHGVYNNTMIIVTADNGEFHSAHALADKWYPYQESIRVPLIIKDPRIPKSKRGTLDDSLTLNVDLAETILGAAGLEKDEQMQGRDIADLYRSQPTSKKPWRKEFFYEFPPVEAGIPASTALVQKDWKYIVWTGYNREQLFNLRNDPFEMNDLFNNSKYKNQLGKMRKRHLKLRFEVAYPNVPGTECDHLWPSDTNYSLLPNCSMKGLIQSNNRFFNYFKYSKNQETISFFKRFA